MQNSRSDCSTRPLPVTLHVEHPILVDRDLRSGAKIFGIHKASVHIHNGGGVFGITAKRNPIYSKPTLEMDADVTESHIQDSFCFCNATVADLEVAPGYRNILERRKDRPIPIDRDLTAGSKHI